MQTRSSRNTVSQVINFYLRAHIVGSIERTIPPVIIKAAMGGGPSPTLIGTTVRTLKAKYEVKDDSTSLVRRVFCPSKHQKEIYYQLEDELEVTWGWWERSEDSWRVGEMHQHHNLWWRSGDWQRHNGSVKVSV
jgi:hypothetical protein